MQTYSFIVDKMSKVLSSAGGAVVFVVAMCVATINEINTFCSFFSFFTLVSTEMMTCNKMRNILFVVQSLRVLKRLSARAFLLLRSLVGVNVIYCILNWHKYDGFQRKTERIKR